MAGSNLATTTAPRGDDESALPLDHVAIDLTEPEVAVGSDVEERVLDAALALVARWGVGKTSLADVAKEAGCSRATVYRAFPGGKQHLFDEVARRELATYLEAILEVVDGAEDLADAVTRGLVVATRLVRDHDAVQFVLAHEPGLLVPLLGFKQVDRLYRHTAVVVGPHLERFVPADRAAWLAEWAARTFITYLFKPDPDLDLAVVDDTRRLVGSFVLPSFVAPATEAGRPAPAPMAAPTATAAAQPPTTNTTT